MASSKIEFKIGPANITKNAGVMGFDVDSKDFNDYTHHGVYQCGGTNQGFTHAPHNSDNGFLMVIGDHSPIQIWFGGYVGLVRARHRVNDEWTSWVDVVNWGGKHRFTFGRLARCAA